MLGAGRKKKVDIKAGRKNRLFFLQINQLTNQRIKR